MFGIVSWKITYDNKEDNEIFIPVTYLVKSLETRMLSPQHWGQVANDNFPMKHGSVAITGSDEIFWNGISRCT